MEKDSLILLDKKLTREKPMSSKKDDYGENSHVASQKHVDQQQHSQALDPFLLPNFEESDSMALVNGASLFLYFGL